MSTVKLRSPITTHILDIGLGKPAAGVPVKLEMMVGKKWKSLSSKKTNADGRVEDLLVAGSKIKAGTYRLNFEIGKYFKGETFYPYAEIVFEVKKLNQHYHVPLLVSAYGYSTYRGS
jgi:5-hydroxyisourate hydrolase